MSREMLNLKNAAEHVHMDANELRHVAQRGEIEFDEHGGDLWFEHRVLDEWAQRNLLASGHREQLRQHGVMLEEQRRSNSSDWRVWRLFAPTGIVLDVPGKAKAGILRDMTSIADATGFVYDPDGHSFGLRSLDDDAVHADFVIRHHALADISRLCVYGDSSLQNHLLHVSAASHACVGEHFLKFFTLGKSLALFSLTPAPHHCGIKEAAHEGSVIDLLGASFSTQVK